MELSFTPQKIKELIERSKSAEHYSKNDDVWSTLDGDFDDARMLATTAKKLLDEYFRRNPDDKIENYL